MKHFCKKGHILSEDYISDKGVRICISCFRGAGRKQDSWKKKMWVAISVAAFILYVFWAIGDAQRQWEVTEMMDAAGTFDELPDGAVYYRGWNY